MLGIIIYDKLKIDKSQRFLRIIKLKASLITLVIQYYLFVATPTYQRFIMLLLQNFYQTLYYYLKCSLLKDLKLAYES